MITIGKRYKLNIRPNAEYSCPNCDANIGQAWLTNHPEATGQIVTVFAVATGYNLHSCGACWPRPEGLYHVAFQDNRCAMFPYTWLEPLNESN